MIDIMALWQLYERRELTEIRQIKGDNNPVDAITKPKPNKCLEQLVSSNWLEIKVKGQVDQSDKK